MIFRLFGRSPFQPLQHHMQLVCSCVALLRDLFRVLEEGGFETKERSEKGDVGTSLAPRPELLAIIEKIQEREYLADLAKNDLRRRLEGMLFLPFDRCYLLEILALQDMIADNCEKIAQRAALYPTKLLPAWKEQFHQLLEREISHVYRALKVIEEIDQLAKSSYGGREADYLDALIEEIAIGHAHCRRAEQVFMRQLFSSSKQLTAPELLIWERMVERLSKISFFTEKALYRLRRVLPRSNIWPLFGGRT